MLRRARRSLGRLGFGVCFAAAAMTPASEGPPLFIPQEEYYRGYLCVTGLPDEEAPEFIRIAREYDQHTLVEYRRSRVIDAAATRDAPRAALAVKTWWPDVAGVRYRILDYGDFIVIDDVSGVRGRPTSGVLGVLFKLLGTATVQWSRMAISARNEQVVRANGRKIIAKTSVVTVAPTGLGGAVQPWPF